MGKTIYQIASKHSDLIRNQFSRPHCWANTLFRFIFGGWCGPFKVVLTRLENTTFIANHILTFLHKTFIFLLLYFLMHFAVFCFYHIILGTILANYEWNDVEIKFWILYESLVPQKIIMSRLLLDGNGNVKITTSNRKMWQFPKDITAVIFNFSICNLHIILDKDKSCTKKKTFLSEKVSN